MINMTITDGGRNMIASAIKGDKTGGFNAFNKINIGESGGNTDPTLNDLDLPIINAPVTLDGISLSNDNVVEFYKSFSGDTYTGSVIREVGIYDSSAAIMLLRITTDPIGPLEAGKNYEIRITIEVE